MGWIYSSGYFYNFSFFTGRGVMVIDQGGEACLLPTSLTRSATTLSRSRGRGTAIQAVAAVCKGQVEFLVGPEIRHKLLHPREGCLEGCWHERVLAESRKADKCRKSLRLSPCVLRPAARCVEKSATTASSSRSPLHFYSWRYTSQPRYLPRASCTPSPICVGLMAT